MPHEIRHDKTLWSLAQAYAGLKELETARPNAGQRDGLVWVVATPDGGAQSVRLHLPSNWEELDDAELLERIVQKS